MTCVGLYMLGIELVLISLQITLECEHGHLKILWNDYMYVHLLLAMYYGLAVA